MRVFVSCIFNQISIHGTIFHGFDVFKTIDQGLPFLVTYSSGTLKKALIVSLQRLSNNNKDRRIKISYMQ